MAKVPQETKTHYICPLKHAPRGFAWRGMCPKRHRERCPKCPYEPFGVSYKTADLDAHVEATEREADEQGMDEDERRRAVKSARAHGMHHAHATRARELTRTGVCTQVRPDARLPGADVGGVGDARALPHPRRRQPQRRGCTTMLPSRSRHRRGGGKVKVNHASRRSAPPTHQTTPPSLSGMVKSLPLKKHAN